MEKAIEFLLDSHASLTVKVEANTEAIAKLTGTVDRVSTTVDRLSSTVDRLSSTVGVLSGVVEGERGEIRSAVDAMLGFAEAMGENVKLLTRMQQGTSKRVTVLEKRVERLEKPKK
jgi:archaellum component FlaC